MLFLLNLNSNATLPYRKAYKHIYIKYNKTQMPHKRHLCFIKDKKQSLLYLVNDSLERSRVVHGEVSENLAVNLDTSLVKSTHKLRI